MPHNPVLARNLTGLSITEFLRLFPDSDACLRHILHVKYGDQPACPRCGKSSRWHRVGKTQSFAPSCCFGARIHPLTNTLFAKTGIPLHKWFYAILHFCNTGTGVGAVFISRHLGISHAAAVRMADRIRAHFRRIDSQIRLGGVGERVYIVETKMKNVIDPVVGSRNSMRLLIAGDARDFCILAIPKGDFRSARALLEERVHPGSVLVFRDAATSRKVFAYRNPLFTKTFPREVGPDPYDSAFMELSVTLIRLKLFLISNHVWIMSRNINKYISSFEFVYRRNKTGRITFFDAIGSFPSIDRAR